MRDEYTAYKAICPEGKIYIGRTKMHLSEGIRAHKYYSKNNETRFAKAIRKFQDKIVWEILEDNILSKQEADRIEGFYIQKYNSKDETIGYNVKSGATKTMPKDIKAVIVNLPISLHKKFKSKCIDLDVTIKDYVADLIKTACEEE